MNNKERNKAFKRAIRDYLTAHSRDLRRADHAANKANWDIYFGPGMTKHSDDRYFASLNRLRRFVEKDLSELWIDLNCGHVHDREPEAWKDEETEEWVEPYLENTWHLERKEIAKILFGEVANYL